MNCTKCHKIKPDTDFYRNSGSTCKECAKRAAVEWRSRNRTKVRHQANARYHADRERLSAVSLAYYYANKETILPKVHARSRERRRDNLVVKLTHGIRKRMSKAIRGSCPRDWCNLIGYDPALLVPHLEALFEPWMSWSNYGTEWHVDHRRPVSSFQLPEQVRECWALSNLRPLRALDNLRKGARWNENPDTKNGPRPAPKRELTEGL